MDVLAIVEWACLGVFKGLYASCRHLDFLLYVLAWDYVGILLRESFIEISPIFLICLILLFLIDQRNLWFLVSNNLEVTEFMAQKSTTGRQTEISPTEAEFDAR